MNVTRLQELLQDFEGYFNGDTPMADVVPLVCKYLTEEDAAIGRTAYLIALAYLIDLNIPDGALEGFCMQVAHAAPLTRTSLIALGDTLTSLRMAREIVATETPIFDYMMMHMSGVPH